MFKTSQPVQLDALKHEICENPRDERDTDSKTIAKVKDRATKPLELKFGLPYYYLSGKFGEDEDNDSKNLASHDALIGVAYRCAEMKLRTQSFDLTNALLVPVVADANGATPAD